ncbi:MAG TPA: 2,3-bisphosphoglycerate-independent phosphoglycerate mutase [Armatimonadota bacterium]|nr:2,3-bisphosphoglycerate-independent phosphoglycerate mutase [Armatimonadota bacterium]
MESNARAILLIGDGMADRPVASLGGRTPLEAADTPNMNRLAREGESGLMDPIRPGIRVGSDTGHLAILGYDPYKIYTGRGPFEAAGIGMDVSRGDVSFRCNFATVDANLKVLDRRAGRISEGTKELADAINGITIDDVTFFFKESVAHRGALVMHGPGLGAQVSDIDPHRENERILEAAPLDEQDSASKKTADLLNQWVLRTYEILKDHPVNKAREAQGQLPANIVLPRGVGIAPDIAEFDTLHDVVSACVVETGLIRGIARYLNMDLIDVPGATGGLDSDLTAMAHAVVDALDNHTFVLCNVKGPDVAGHDGDGQAKVEAIQRIDQMVGYLYENLGDTDVLVVTADHSTPCVVKDHSGDAVPIVFWSRRGRIDDCTEFNERAVTRGGVGRIRGTDVMPLITQLMGVQEKFGA